MARKARAQRRRQWHKWNVHRGGGTGINGTEGTCTEVEALAYMARAQRRRHGGMHGTCTEAEARRRRNWHKWHGRHVHIGGGTGINGKEGTCTEAEALA